MFIIDAKAGALLGANASGWKVWGLDPATAAPPIALDRAMPALQRLLQIADHRGKNTLSHETLMFWTARGLARLVCRIDTRDASIIAVTVNVPNEEATGNPVAQPQEVEQRINGHPSQPYDLPPEVAHNAWLAHELRTPLSAVIAYAEVLKDGHFGPLANARYQGYARDIYEAARHALGVVDSMLRGDPTQSVVPPLAFADLEPARVVERCLSVVRPLADRAGLELDVEYAPRLPRIVADEQSLKQMLLNLLANAIKFARRGDRVTIGVTYDGHGALHISVADTGPGMGCGSGRGTGLGLPLTRALAAANGAALDIESEPGRGTRATITFGPDRIVPV
jgi:two-component system, cell cycle sensor histidine kinase PleC